MGAGRCEHCKLYAPEWELIAKYFKPVASLVVAKMDFQRRAAYKYILYFWI